MVDIPVPLADAVIQAVPEPIPNPVPLIGPPGTDVHLIVCSSSLCKEGGNVIFVLLAMSSLSVLLCLSLCMLYR